MIASLPMYDRPETADANDRLWQNIREAAADHVPGLPQTLNRDGDIWGHWKSPSLHLSQTCGMPYRLRLRDKVFLVASPVHLIDAKPGHYRSAIVVRADDPRDRFEGFEGARLAVNDMLSQSGWAAPQVMAVNAGFIFSDVLTTGSHAASALAVRMKAADIAAIDLVCWTMMDRWDDVARDLKVIALTPQTPALPYVTAFAEYAAPLHDALDHAVAALTKDDRDTLCLSGVTQIGDDAYAAVPSP